MLVCAPTKRITRNRDDAICSLPKPLTTSMYVYWSFIAGDGCQIVEK